MKGKTPNKQNKSNLNPKQAKTSQTKNPKTPKQTKPPTNQKKKPKKTPPKKGIQGIIKSHVVYPLSTEESKLMVFLRKIQQQMRKKSNNQDSMISQSTS